MEECYDAEMNFQYKELIIKYDCAPEIYSNFW
jgi:hypothetical protein